MKTGLAILLIICFAPGALCSIQPVILENVQRPSIIDVEGDHLFVMDVEKMHVFSMDPLKHLKAFGKKGEGPGEYPVSSSTSNTIRAYAKFLLHEALNKILFSTLKTVF